MLSDNLVKEINKIILIIDKFIKIHQVCNEVNNSIDVDIKLKQETIPEVYETVMESAGFERFTNVEWPIQGVDEYGMVNTNLGLASYYCHKSGLIKIVVHEA